jgi:hypothetical protein
MKGNGLMNEKMMKVFGGVIAGFVIFIILLFLLASCSKSSYTYEKLEQKMLDVAKSYYKENEDELPSQDKDQKVYTLKQMISDGKIEELDKLFDDDDIKCDGSVTVSNNNGYYSYSPYLSCGNDYKTKYLYEKIIEDNLVETGVGLYESGDQYIMKGEVTNNYVSYNNKLFRIMRINDDNSIRLMEEDGLSSITWDDRYNEEVNFTTGINEYILNNQISSRLKEALENYYTDSEYSDIWTDEFKGYIKTQTLCIGKRSQDDTSKDGSTECSVQLEDQLLGTLAMYEYLQASLDTSCSSTLDKTCKNYNWLSTISHTIWTITAETDRSNYAYSIYKLPTLVGCRTKSYVNAVFNLTEKAIYVSGTGTSTDPYIFK